jgi:hypothetical protein
MIAPFNRNRLAKFNQQKPDGYFRGGCLKDERAIFDYEQPGKIIGGSMWETVSLKAEAENLLASEG